MRFEAEHRLDRGPLSAIAEVAGGCMGEEEGQGDQEEAAQAEEARQGKQEAREGGAAAVAGSRRSSGDS